MHPRVWPCESERVSSLGEASPADRRSDLSAVRLTGSGLKQSSGQLHRLRDSHSRAPIMEGSWEAPRESLIQSGSALTQHSGLYAHENKRFQLPCALLTSVRTEMSSPSRSYTPIVLAFLAGVIATHIFFTQPHLGIRDSSSKFKRSADDFQDLAARAEPWVGSTVVHSYPPANPTNDNPSLFPSDVGYPGPTPTGDEPAVVETAPAYPKNFGGQGLLIVPEELSDNNFDLLKKWGNLSPWYSNPGGTFGVKNGPETPQGCSVIGLHLLHRHGARYPTSDSEST